MRIGTSTLALCAGLCAKNHRIRWGQKSRRGRTGPERSEPESRRWSRLRVFSVKEEGLPVKSVTKRTKKRHIGQTAAPNEPACPIEAKKDFSICECRHLTPTLNPRECFCQPLASIELAWRQTPLERESEVRRRLSFRRRGPLVSGRKAGCRILVGPGVSRPGWNL